MKILFAFLLFIPLSTDSVRPPRHFNIDQLVTGVWAAIHNDNNGYAMCNAGIVDLGDKTIVYDPFLTARELKKWG